MRPHPAPNRSRDGGQRRPWPRRIRNVARPGSANSLRVGRASGVRLLDWRMERPRRKRQARGNQQHQAGDRRLRPSRALRDGPRIQWRELQHLRRSAEAVASDLGRFRWSSAAPRGRNPGRQDGPRRQDHRPRSEDNHSPNHVDAESGRERPAALGVNRPGWRTDSGIRRHVYTQVNRSCRIRLVRMLAR